MADDIKPAGGWTQIYRSIFDQSIVGIVLCDMQGAIVECNPAFCRMIGYTAAELTEKTVKDITHPDDWAAEAAVLQERREGRTANQHYSVEKRYLHKNGRVLWANVNATTIRDVNSTPVFGFAIVEDITNRIHAQERLAEEKERLGVILQDIGDAVVSTDVNGRILLISKVAEKWLSKPADAVAGQPVWQVFNLADPGNQQPFAEALEAAVRDRRHYEPSTPVRLAGADGTAYWVAVTGNPMFDPKGTPVGMVFVLRDMTDRLLMEQEHIRTEKLESLGHLAAGIAHDFNNFLTTILGNVSLAKTHAQTPAPIAELLSDAETAIQQARDLTQQLLAFAKGGDPVKVSLAPATLIKESAELALRGSKSTLELQLPASLWSIGADPQQLRQAIRSLVINADQAMPGGGPIRITAENTLIVHGDPIPLPPGRYVRIAIGDSGVGIPDRIISKIFDPYFTTKKQGSGMGLATTLSIVKNHGGHIAVESRVGIGTTFEIHLPVAEPESAPATPRPAKPADARTRVLVMDDEDTIRSLATRILTRGGCDVTTTATGEEAIKAYTQALETDNPFDIVILDLTIRGGMGGKDTIHRLREIDPAVKAIVSSGYSTDPIMSNYRRYGFRGIVPKPYQSEELLHAVAELSRIAYVE